MLAAVTPPTQKTSTVPDFGGDGSLVNVVHPAGNVAIPLKVMSQVNMAACVEQGEEV